MGGDGRIRVLFVMGHGSSGTTILGNTLGEVDGFFHAGELRTIWSETNGVNLNQNIAPTRSRARLILEKGPDHAVRRVLLRRV